MIRGPKLARGKPEEIYAIAGGALWVRSNHSRDRYVSSSGRVGSRRFGRNVGRLRPLPERSIPDTIGQSSRCTYLGLGFEPHLDGLRFFSREYRAQPLSVIRIGEIFSEVSSP